MNKDEIREILNNLNTEDEIVNFVKERLLYLEENSEEKMLGQNYTDSFRDYISSKTHFKTGDRFSDRECADLVYDDIVPYIELVKEIKDGDGLSNNFWAMNDVFFCINKYMPVNESSIISGDVRQQLYEWNNRISIKDIKEKRCGECAERAGLAQNMFKFLGMDSEFVCGYIEDQAHAYNLFYPKGYDNVPVLIYDTSQYIDFVSQNGQKVSFPMFKALTLEEHERLLSGEPLELDLTCSEQDCRNVYPSYIEGYEMVSENPIYTFGLDNSYTNNIVR